ncbi:MAG: ATP-dependent DNA helicase RecG [Spirochaetales bacterium]|nr:ATP-dependent DNA helicase RecG [Spirochaetales bacterium]
MLLCEINDSLTNLPGIGEKNLKLFNRVGINRTADLLSYYPRRFSDRTETLTFREAVLRHEAAVRVRVSDYRLIRRGVHKQILKIIVSDGTDYGCLVCFNRSFLKDSLHIGSEYLVTGKWTYNYGEFQCSSFEYEDADKTFEICHVPSKIIPVYPLTEKLTQRLLRNVMTFCLNKYLPKLEDELPNQYIEQHGLAHKADMLRNMHFPIRHEDYALAKRTVLYEEFFFQQLFLISRKNKTANQNKHRTPIKFSLKEKILAALPFSLTDYQENALSEIENDLFSNHVMQRLLQGDVGCGKTIVAILAMADVVESGQQCAIMVPTEMLARQHYINIGRMCEAAGISVELLQGKMRKSQRDALLRKIKSGETQIIVGTHSLFSKDVVYHNLGLAVIDEQHRFGVEQRLSLVQKGECVDLLLMTATPIPQSLALSMYGDLELTTMRGKIAGRIPVKTWVIDDVQARIEKMYEWIKTLLAQNGRAIIVYAQIDDEDETGSVKNLETEYEHLQNVFAEYGTAMIHSRIDDEEKYTIVQKFREGQIKLIAATTVVEVGIDIPDANVIVIENAERYGLATLHQLRGRVGRNSKESYMVLISKLDNLTDEGKKRLQVIRDNADGFVIAEEDLMLRGPGDFIGLRQSGLPETLQNIRQELHLLEAARDDAKNIFETDPDLDKPENLNTKKSFLERLKAMSDVQ